MAVKNESQIVNFREERERERLKKKKKTFEREREREARVVEITLSGQGRVLIGFKFELNDFEPFDLDKMFWSVDGLLYYPRSSLKTLSFFSRRSRFLNLPRYNNNKNHKYKNNNNKNNKYNNKYNSNNNNKK